MSVVVPVELSYSEILLLKGSLFEAKASIKKDLQDGLIPEERFNDLIIEIDNLRSKLDEAWERF